MRSAKHRSRERRRHRRGATAVEFAMVLPVMITLLLGTVDFGQLRLHADRRHQRRASRGRLRQHEPVHDGHPEHLADQGHRGHPRRDVPADRLRVGQPRRDRDPYCRGGWPVAGARASELPVPDADQLAWPAG